MTFHTQKNRICLLKLFTSLCLLVVYCLFSSEALARTYYVNVKTGSDEYDGLSSTTPFKTIQYACDQVEPGDTVRVAEGVYYENIIVKTPGRADAPITIYAESAGKFETLITGADPDIRERRVQWDLVDQELGLYAIDFNHEPNRVNVGEIDLFPYSTLESLKSFALADDFPAPEHGFYYDAAGKQLYVRLHASGRYGVPNPNKQTMNVGGPAGVGQRLHLPTGPEHVLIGILTDQPAHVIIDGFTFQSAGTSAVFTGADNVTVQNCWFVGCPGGVTGRGKYDGKEQRGNNIRVLHCDYSEPGVWQDMADAIDKYGTDPEVRPYYWWARKYNGLKQRCYERGMVINANDNWEVAHSYMHDCFEALSFITFGKGSTNGHIHHNVFGRSIDNHLEFEYELENLVVHDNLFVDAMRSISYQAKDRNPGPIWFFRNVIINSDRQLELFHRAGKTGGTWNKFMIQKPIPKPGLLIYNNTVISRNAWGDGFNENLYVFNNMFWLSECQLEDKHAEFDGNVAYFSESKNAEYVAGSNGYVADSAEALGLEIQGSFSDWKSLRLQLKNDSPALRVHVDPPIPLDAETDAGIDASGAVAPHQVWLPPKVGPNR